MSKLLGATALLVAAAFGVAAAAADTGGSNRPFRGALAGSATFQLDPSCPFTGRRTWSAGSGTASHLGLVAMVSDHCTPPGNVIAGGEMTLVAANGDELHLTYSGTCEFDPSAPVGAVFPCHTPFVVVGGTGRFADATGGGHTTAHVTYAGFGTGAWPATWAWEGTLGY